MDLNKLPILNTFVSFFTLAVIVVVLLVAPWSSVDWGVFRLGQERTITVTGEARLKKDNQVARFSASVREEADDKDEAVNSVNVAMEELIGKLKEFGIASEDIKTEQVSVSENQRVEIMIYPPVPVDENQKKWMASNSISIVLRDVSQASDLASLLTNSGATDVYGPSFSVDEEDKSDDSELSRMAMEDARIKAMEIAELAGASLGKVLSVSEGGSYPVYPYQGFAKNSLEVDVASSVPLEPGQSEMMMTVNVVFEMR